MVLLDGREVDGMDENMVALLEGRAELDTDTVRGAAGRKRGGWFGWVNGRSAGRVAAGMDGNTVALVVGRAELDTDTVHGAAGRERGMGKRWRRWW